MNHRFICPHCHSPIDPHAMEVADCAHAECRICPECDYPIVWTTVPGVSLGQPSTEPVEPPSPAPLPEHLAL